MKKILHISHSQDMDGKVPPMLTKIFNPDCEVEVLLLSNKDMHIGVINKLNEIMETMEQGNIDGIDEIIITDLGLNAEAFDVVAKTAQFIPLNFYDHHMGSLLNEESYKDASWIHVDITVSATKLYATHLYEKCIVQAFVDTDRFKIIVDAVSDYDTFEFKRNNNDYAERLNILLNIAGDKIFENCLDMYLSGASDIMGLEKHLSVVDYVIDDRQRFIDYIENTSKIVTIKDRKCVIVFTDQFKYVSELGYQICEKHKEIDLLMAINPSNTTVQLRARKSSANLHIFAEEFGGGGHPLAAGFPFNMQFYASILLLWDASNEYLVTK